MLPPLRRAGSASGFTPRGGPLLEIGISVVHEASAVFLEDTFAATVTLSEVASLRVVDRVFRPDPLLLPCGATLSVLVLWSSWASSSSFEATTSTLSLRAADRVLLVRGRTGLTGGGISRRFAAALGGIGEKSNLREKELHR